MRILFDSKNSFYKEPFGTLLPGEVCRIRIRIPLSCKTKKVSFCLLSQDQSLKKIHPMEKEGADEAYETFLCRFSLSEEGLFFYYFLIETENESFRLYRFGFRDTNMEEGDLWQISCIPKSFSTPKDFSGRVMYQIFPDRFYKEGETDLTGKLLPYTIHENKKDIPHFLPDEKGEVKNCDFFGGNLQGIRKKLPYLKHLGVKTLYLNPIFKAFSNHRYDTADYKKIDEMLGDEKDFRALCKSAHRLGMKVILDGVFSHTGSNSKYFDAEGVFGGGAVSSPASPYRTWFDFQEYPQKYTSWWGIKTLPCTNEMDKSFLDYIIFSEDAVVAKWLRLGADGWRLDVADELPDEFIALLRLRLKKEKKDALLIGEVWEDASNKVSYGKRREYFTKGELDSVMNYPFREAILDFVLEKDGGFSFQKKVMDLVENYPEQVVHTLMNLLSTHDTPRILSLLSPTPAPSEKKDRAGYKMGKEDLLTAKKRARIAFFLQFILPGMPSIYYGDEIGTEGFEDPFCRGFFDWERVEESDFLPFVKNLCRLKNKEKPLREGKTKVETDGKGRLFIARSCGKKSLCAIINLGEPLLLPKEKKCLLSYETKEKDGNLILSRASFLLYREK